MNTKRRPPQRLSICNLQFAFLILHSFFPPLAAAAPPPASPVVPVSPAKVPALKDVYRKSFDVGVALEGRVPESYSPAEARNLLRTQFTYVTPANCMKMNHIARQAGRYDFDQADGLVSFAEKAGLKLCGHCLLWRYDSTPAWFYQAAEGRPLTHDELLGRMQAYIAAVAGRWRGRIASWDVVNEALGEDSAELRPRNG